jgi:hypothetical protein
MKRYRRKAAFASLTVVFIAGLLWQLSPVQAIVAIANLSDPAKLATLGERAANPRLNKIVYWLHAAEKRGMPGEVTIWLAQSLNWTREPRASLVKESLLRNLRIARELGLFTGDNLERLRRGRAGIITRGPYAQTPVEIDHVIPYSLAGEAGNELANLEMLPETVNRRKSNQVGERQLELAVRLWDAGLISEESLARVQAQARKPGLRTPAQK